MVKCTKEYVDELVKILDTFSEASEMEINWKNSSAYCLIGSPTNPSGF